MAPRHWILLALCYASSASATTYMHARLSGNSTVSPERVCVPNT